MRRMLYIFTVVFFILGSIPALATITYECEYVSYSDKDGNHNENFSLTFVVDDKSGKAYQVGNNGSDEVVYIDKGLGKSFIEITATGNVMTTSIDSKMNSVHSRNTILDELMPSQYYGVCVKK